ncbi:MAG: hypothetical protein GXP17_00955, partial [Gammaproteobacteria bacterium]|nr:hypothetical protein [Gammaproteobacteria bacterium]
MSSSQMTKPHHNWPRFWIPSGKTIQLDSSGFLYDPEDEHAIFYYTDGQPDRLEQLGSTPVAILLGEPGIGKSTALKEEFERLQAENEACLYRELNQYQSDSRLIDDIFGSKKVQAWKQGSYRLTLLLDSLDECNLSIPTVTKILARQLGSLPRERLNLRLTCRTADWSIHFTRKLRELWQGEDENSSNLLGVFELAPLRKKDVQRAVLDRKLDADAFLHEICLKEIQPLASYPNTLNMLLGLFGRPDGLPGQRAEIYRLGCEALAKERSTFRQESRQTGRFSACQRMAVAGRIAAQMVFGHRSTIWRDDVLDAVTTDLVEGDVVGGTERADGQDFPVDIHILWETIECALFSGRDEQRTGFSHQSYVEFLAAWYLHSHNLETQQALTLLCHPDDGRIPLQHAETAIWLASLNKEIFTALVATEPLLLLRADLSDMTDGQKAQLTEKLLDSFAAQTEFDTDWSLRQHYRKLGYPDLAKQLRPYIVGKDMAFAARRVAMAIAAACHVRELREDLVSIALDQKEKQQHRLNAVDAVIDCADVHELASLRPLAMDNAGNDLEDKLKVAVIPSLWPDHISTKEVFELLLHAQSENCLDRFRHSQEKFLSQLVNDDLIIALQWVTDAGNNLGDYEVDCFKDDIMVEAWKKVDNPHVLRVFADTVWVCLGRHEPVFNRCNGQEKNWFEQDSEKRRAVIIALLEAHSESAKKSNRRNLVDEDCQIILPEDNFWLLSCYESSSDPGLRAKLAKCIDAFVSWDVDIAWFDALVTAACIDAPNTESPLADVMAFYLEPIELDSEAARVCKDLYAKQSAWRKKRSRLLDPPPSVRVEQALQEFESGKNTAWMCLWKELSLPDEAIRYPWKFDNITKLPGWLRATCLERTHIVRCAETWVMESPLSQKDISCFDNRNSNSHTATYLALCLLSEESPQSLVNVPGNWSRWAELIVTFPRDNKHEPRRALLRQAYSNAPAIVSGTFQNLIDQDISASRPLYRVRELAVVWDGQIAGMLNKFLTKPGLTLSHVSTLLDVLLKHGDEAAFEFAGKLIVSAFSFVGPPNYPLILVAAQSLVVHQLQKSWQIIWKKMLIDSYFGKELMLGYANRPGRYDRFFASFSEAQITELYFWLEEHFPVASDIHYPSGKAQSTARDEVGQLRNNCLDYLSGLGTQAAIDALCSIFDRFPERDWLKYLLNEAKQVFRKTSLQALSPTELVTYTRHRDARLARSSNELMEAVVFSLQRLQKKLHGQTPLAPFLWNIFENGNSGRPKSEDRFSDFIKHHLEIDLPTFVIDREVQIENLREHGIGKRTDLKIEAKDL